MWGLLSREAGQTGVGVTVAVFLEKQNLKYGMKEPRLLSLSDRYVTDDPSQMLSLVSMFFH